MSSLFILILKDKLMPWALQVITVFVLQQKEDCFLYPMLANFMRLQQLINLFMRNISRFCFLLLRKNYLESQN